MNLFLALLLNLIRKRIVDDAAEPKDNSSSNRFKSYVKRFLNILKCFWLKLKSSTKKISPVRNENQNKNNDIELEQAVATDNPSESVSYR